MLLSSSHLISYITVWWNTIIHCVQSKNISFSKKISSSSSTQFSVIDISTFNELPTSFSRKYLIFKADALLSEMKDVRNAATNTEWCAFTDIQLKTRFSLIQSCRYWDVFHWLYLHLPTVPCSRWEHLLPLRTPDWGCYFSSLSVAHAHCAR